MIAFCPGLVRRDADRLVRVIICEVRLGFVEVLFKLLQA